MHTDKGDRAVPGRLGITDEAPHSEAPDQETENRMLEWARPRGAPCALAEPLAAARLVGRFVDETTRVDEAWRSFQNQRAVPFNETQYQVDAADGMTCLDAVRAAVRRSGTSTSFSFQSNSVMCAVTTSG